MQLAESFALKWRHDMILKNLIKKTAFGIALGAGIIVASAGSFAADGIHYYPHSDNGSTFSYYSDYVDITAPQTAPHDSDAFAGAPSHSGPGGATHSNSHTNHSGQCWHRDISHSASGHWGTCN